MSRSVVADSTCLIGLSRTGRLDLLRELFQSILIPPSVYDEVVTSGVAVREPPKLLRQIGLRLASR